MESDFNSSSLDSLEDEIPVKEIFIGESGRFVYSKKRIYGRMHFLKHPSEEYKNDLLTIESLRKEFAIGYSLDHPNIVKYLRFEDNILFEEYIDGKSLRELLEEDDPRLWDKQFIERLCLQFLDVLRYLRGMGVVHNDIKPENIIITRIGNILKLIDFNCAQSSSIDILGGYTSIYKAPEQGTGVTDSYSDLYQVGKVLEELCTRTGYEKKWKRFIEAATASHPDNRVSLELAENLIPGKNKSKKISLIILFLICLGVISLILFPEKQNETKTIPTSSSVKDTVIIERIKEYPIGDTKEKRETQSLEIRNVIEKRISAFTDNYYKENLYPICKEALENKGARLNAEEEAELQRAIEEGYICASEYSITLTSEYPEERIYIEKECLQCFEMKISSLLLKLYPPM